MQLLDPIKPLRFSFDTAQRRIHLVGDLLEAALEDGEGDGVKHWVGSVEDQFESIVRSCPQLEHFSDATML